MDREKCGRCGWKYGGFHICVDLSTPEPIAPPKSKKQRSSRATGQPRGPVPGSTRSAEHCENISLAQKERYAKIREKNRTRDEAIVKRYKDGGLGTIKLAKEFGISKDAVRAVLKRAESEGELVMRKPGGDIVNTERDEKMIERYKHGDIGQAKLAEEFGVSKDVAWKVLKRAEAEGRLIMRKRGQSVGQGVK